MRCSVSTQLMAKEIHANSHGYYDVDAELCCDASPAGNSMPTLKPNRIRVFSILRSWVKNTDPRLGCAVD
jgi:hypothetical protein